MKNMVAETGRLLQEKKLVTRTWGNVSMRSGEKRFLITPSGLDYSHTMAEDIACVNMEDMSWEGRRKPSSERGVHLAAYATFPDVGFVIHTHQDYASAAGLVDIDNLRPTAEERNLIGKTEVAKYGLPGTKKLAGNVRRAFENGSQVVLMKHHGAVICGTDRDDTVKKAETLEAVCKRAVLEKIKDIEPEKEAFETVMTDEAEISEMLGILKNDYEHVTLVDSEYVVKASMLVKSVRASLDDMAQMIGPRITVTDFSTEKIMKELDRAGAVIVKGIGAFVCAEQEDDMEALAALTEKACISALYTKACAKSAKLSAFDVRLMRLVYKLKYSKQKEG